MHVLGENEGEQNDGEHSKNDESLNEAAEMLEDETDDECVESSSSNSDSEDDIVLAELIEESNSEPEQGIVRTIPPLEQRLSIDTNDRL